MSELFPEAGQSEDVAVSPPNLRGVFLPGIDRDTFADGFGFVTPLGGGGTIRKYGGYGPSAEGSSSFTQLQNISQAMGAFGGGDQSYNFEGLVGPQGIPGRDGLPGLPGLTTVVYTTEQGMFELPPDLESIDGLVTGADKFIYTSSYDTLSIGEQADERQPVGDADKSWKTVASDADGSNLIACESRVWTSADSGVTWAERRPKGDVDASWDGVASDNDGSNLIVAGWGEGLYTSDDSGATWTERQPSGGPLGLWQSVASDSDGSNLIAGLAFGRLYTSANSGATWTERQPAGAVDKYWGSVASDSDGSNLVAAVSSFSQSGRLYTSDDSGATWTERQPAGASDMRWEGVASDADGSNLIVGAYGGRLWTSDDSGATWTERRPDGVDENKNWQRVASDDDGSVLVAEIYGGRIYLSSDSGVTWGEIRLEGDVDANWLGLASDSDGSNLLMAISGGRVYTYLPEGKGTYDRASFAEASVTEAARNLLDDTTTAAQQTTLALGTGDSPTFAGLVVTGNTTIGGGAAGIDYTLTFDGETNDGIITWMEDEDYFKFGDDIVMADDEFIIFDVNAGLTASTTQSQGQGALTAQVNEISTVANNDDTVTLPTAVTGVTVEIINNGAETLLIFPASGDDLGLGVNVAEELEANESVGFVAYDTTNWAKEFTTEIIHAEIHDEDNTDAFVINDAGGDFHSYHTNGLAAGDLADWTFDAGGAGTSFPIASVANSVGSPGTQILVTTTGAHGLAVGDIISQTNLADAAYVGIFEVIATAAATTYEVTASYTATGTGTMDQAATLTADAVAAGVYSFAYYVSGTLVGNNETFDFQLYNEATAVIGSKVRRKYGAANDFGSASGGGVVAVANGDKISLAISNEDSAANIILRNVTIVLVRL